MVAMSDLRELLTQLGFADVRSLLQSGNLVFRGDNQAPSALEPLLTSEVEKRLGIEVDFFVRTAEEWQGVIAQNPFPAEAKRDPSHLIVMFLKNAPKVEAVKSLQSGISGREVLRADDRQAYIVYPDGIGTSRLTNAVIEKALGTRGTGRNWNTVLKLAALATA